MGSQTDTAGAKVFLGAGVILFIGQILHVEDQLDVFSIIAGPQVDEAVVRTQVGKLAWPYWPNKPLIWRRATSLFVGQPFDIGILTIAPNILCQPHPPTRAPVPRQLRRAYYSAALGGLSSRWRPGLDP